MLINIETIILGRSFFVTNTQKNCIKYRNFLSILSGFNEMKSEFRALPRMITLTLTTFSCMSLSTSLIFFNLLTLITAYTCGIYVSTNGTLEDDCGVTVDNPCQSLYISLLKVKSGDVCILAQMDDNTNLELSGRHNTSFTLRKYGDGFATVKTSGTDPFFIESESSIFGKR